VKVAAEAAAGDQRQPSDALGVVIGEGHGDAAAEAVADHRHQVK
jgi:hypothetical protein